MKSFIIGKNECGQRLDKYLAKLLNEAPKSFIYKMLRKKNITLNGKKAEGSEMLILGDELKLFLADDTIDKFRSPSSLRLTEGLSEDLASQLTEGVSRYSVNMKQQSLDVIYEDEDILLVNKPAGVLSQRATLEDISMVEIITDYLLETGALSHSQLATFHPGICNRLDRNTSGLLIAGKSLAGLQQMTTLLRERKVRKFYRSMIYGNLEGQQRLSGYIDKDEKTNIVRYLKDSVRMKGTASEMRHEGELTSGKGSAASQGEYIETVITPLKTEIDAAGYSFTLVEAELITGKTHQIRVHLASIGHPVLGDSKYGIKEINDFLYSRYRLRSQLLHAERLEFPELSGACAGLSEKIFRADAGRQFRNIESHIFGRNTGA